MTFHRLPLIANKLWSWIKKYLVYGKLRFFLICDHPFKKIKKRENSLKNHLEFKKSFRF